MNEQDYIFLKYIDRFYNNRFLSLLLNDYERGTSMIERKTVKTFVDDEEETTNPDTLLFFYILFKQTKANKYINELQKHLAKQNNKISLKECRKTYEELTDVLKRLGVDPLVVTPEVVKNVRNYVSEDNNPK